MKASLGVPFSPLHITNMWNEEARKWRQNQKLRDPFKLLTAVSFQHMRFSRKQWIQDPIAPAYVFFSTLTVLSGKIIYNRACTTQGSQFDLNWPYFIQRPNCIFHFQEARFVSLLMYLPTSPLVSVLCLSWCFDFTPSTFQQPFPLWHGQIPLACQQLHWACAATQWLLEETPGSTHGPKSKGNVTSDYYPFCFAFQRAAATKPNGSSDTTQWAPMTALMPPGEWMIWKC